MLCSYSAHVSSTHNDYLYYVACIAVGYGFSDEQTFTIVDSVGGHKVRIFSLSRPVVFECYSLITVSCEFSFCSISSLGCSCCSHATLSICLLFVDVFSLAGHWAPCCMKLMGCHLSFDPSHGATTSFRLSVSYQQVRFRHTPIDYD